MSAPNTHQAPNIAVFGSINLDLVALCDHLPVAGETVAANQFHQYPGGKGANQALAAARLGASVSMFGAIGHDGYGAAATRLLKLAKVDLSGVAILEDAPTGVALIGVEVSGENQIIVVGGANLAAIAPTNFRFHDVLLVQLECATSQVMAALRAFKVTDDHPHVRIANLAPAKSLPDDFWGLIDVAIVNETEASFYGAALENFDGLVVKTLGSAGAEIWQDGALLASAPAPHINVVDTTGAGDAFCAALSWALAQGMDNGQALKWGVYTASLAATKAGAGPSFPTYDEVAAFMAAQPAP